MVNKLKSISFITGVAGFLLIAGVVVLLFSSCGIANLQKTNAGANYGSEDAGKGEAPKLASRLASNPSLADEDCEDNDRCKETCRDIYDETSSYKKCYNLSIQEVSDIEDVFYTLLSADADDLEDLDSDDLEDYLRIGLDGWVDKLIPRQKQKAERDRYNRFKRTLAWIVEEEDIVTVLEKEDEDNEILKELFLEYCDENSDHRCKNDDSILHSATNSITGDCKLKITDSGLNNCDGYPSQQRYWSVSYESPNTCTFSLKGNFDDRALNINQQHDTIELFVGGNRHFGYNVCSSSPSPISGIYRDSATSPLKGNLGVVFDYSFSDLRYCGYSFDELTLPSSGPCTYFVTVGVHHKKIAEVDEDEKELFIALAGAGKVFFDTAANGDGSAFALGNKLVEQACDGGGDTSVAQCIRTFYCWVKDRVAGTTNIDQDFFNKKGREAIGRKIDLKGCDYVDEFDRI